MQTSNSRIGKENKLSNVLLWQKKKKKKEGIYRHDPTKNTRIDEKYL
jgi:hypothetical protein